MVGSIGCRHVFREYMRPCKAILDTAVRPPQDLRNLHAFAVSLLSLLTAAGAFDPNVAPIASVNTPRDVYNPRQAQVGVKVRF